MAAERKRRKKAQRHFIRMHGNAPSMSGFLAGCMGAVKKAKVRRNGPIGNWGCQVNNLGLWGAMMFCYIDKVSVKAGWKYGFFEHYLKWEII
jgi:hypothetical protein